MEPPVDCSVVFTWNHTSLICCRFKPRNEEFSGKFQRIVFWGGKVNKLERQINTQLSSIQRGFLWLISLLYLSLSPKPALFFIPQPNIIHICLSSLPLEHKSKDCVCFRYIYTAGPRTILDSQVGSHWETDYINRQWPNPIQKGNSGSGPAITCLGTQSFIFKQPRKPACLLGVRLAGNQIAVSSDNPGNYAVSVTINLKQPGIN